LVNPFFGLGCLFKESAQMSRVEKMPGFIQNTLIAAGLGLCFMLPAPPTAQGAKKQQEPAPPLVTPLVTPLTDKAVLPLLAGPDMAACHGNGPGAAVVIKVSNFKALRGTLRIQSYDKPETFLDTGAFIRRIDVPVTGAETYACLALPGPGRYAIVVRHDPDGNTKTDIFRDGFAFPRLNKLKLSRPKFSAVALDFPAGVSMIALRLNYL
jgi:uncharacterized protein (DUF2141 family)